MKKQTYNQSGDSYMGLKNPYFSRLIFIKAYDDTVLPYDGNENFLMTGYAVPDYYRVGLEIIKRK